MIPIQSSNGVNMLLVQKKMLSKAVAIAFLTAVLLAMFLGKLSYFGMEQIRWISPKRSPKSWRNPGKSQKSLFYVIPSCFGQFWGECCMSSQI